MAAAIQGVSLPAYRPVLHELILRRRWTRASSTEVRPRDLPEKTQTDASPPPALLFWPDQFGLPTTATAANGISAATAASNQWLVGLITAAPYVRPLFLSSRNLLTLAVPAALLRCPRLLAHLASQLLPRPSRSNLPHRHHLILDRHLVRVNKHVVAPSDRTLCTRPWDRAEERHCTLLCPRRREGELTKLCRCLSTPPSVLLRRSGER